jgi:hypothetical protein
VATRTSNRRKQVRSLPKRTRREVGRLRSIPGDWWAWSFLPLCLIYVVIVLTHFDHLVVNIYGSSDTSAPLVLAEQFGARAGGHVVSSNYPWDATLIFAEATKWLPAHREIWELGPLLLGLLSIALMSWAALRVAGRWGAALTAVILLCAGPNLLELMFWLTDHTPTWYSLAVLGAFLVLLTDRKMSIGWLPLTILTLCVGVVVGISVATDKELITGGLAPLVLAGVGTWVMTRTALAARAMWFALAAAAATGVGAVVTTSIMRSEGVTTNGYEVKFAVLEAVSTNVKVWWQSVAMLGNGNFFGEAIKFTTVIALVCAALSVGTVLLIPRFAWRHISSRRSGKEAADEQLNVYVIFWTASVVCLSAGFIFSSAPIFPFTPEDLGYLVGLIYAVAAMLPLLARRSVAIRAVVVAGTLVFLLSSVIALGHSNSIKAPPSARGPSPEVAGDVARVAEKMHATYGYGLYWDAAAITWRSNFRVLVAPIVGCAGSQGLCPGPNGYIEAWYNRTPRRTFLLTDSSLLAWGPPAALGRAVATYHFGTVTMYVYNYNIIENLF